MTPEPSPAMPSLSLGAKIRQQRKARGLTLTELAEQCDISPSFLSQIERDQANPSVATLYTIAEAFKLPLATFFEEELSPKNSSHEYVETIAKVVRADQRKTIIYPGSRIRNELLSPDLQRDIQMMWVVMPPGTDSGNFVHEGEECGMILQGQVETWIGDEHYILGPGDAIYHPSTVPHRTRNIGDTEAILVVAKTPPSL